MNAPSNMSIKMKIELDTMADLLKRSEGYQIVRERKGVYAVLVFVVGEEEHRAGGGRDLQRRTQIHVFKGIQMDSKRQVEKLLYVLREFEPCDEPEQEKKEEKTITWHPDVD